MSIYHTTRRDLMLGKRTHLVGILNLTPDSFSDGGDFVDLDAASLHFHFMVKAGAEISSGKTMEIFRCTRQHTWCVLANVLSRP